jgi:hypothetical protein
MMSRRWGIILLLAVVAIATTVSLASAQATTGRISGSVKDTSGGVLPGVAVTVTETKTGFTRTDVTDAKGVYTFVNLPLGQYTVSAELQGFKKASKTGFELVADGRIGADFALEVGAFTETVQVTVASETVNTISGEVSRTIDRAQVQDMALNGRNYMQMVTLVPGAPLVDTTAPLDLMTGLGINTTVNGSRTNASLLTVDGGMNMDAGSNNSQISNVGIDFIDQVSVKTSNFSAEYGRNSGAAINVVTRSGTNIFKGSAFEYMRRNAWDENDYFNKLKGVAKPKLTYDNPGFSLGGPISKDKIFFFGGLEWKRIRRLTSPSTRTLPTSLMRGGNFSQLSTAIKDPLTGQAFPGNVIPSNRLTADGRAIANVYEQMSKVAAQYNDGVLTNNAVFQNDNPFDFRQEMVRLDYQPSGAHRLTTRVVFDHYNLTEPGGTFINSQMPTVPTNRKRPGRNVQVNHYWTLTNTLVNEVKFNYSGNGQKIPPVGDAWKRATYGFEFPQIYAGGGAYADSIPNVDFNGGYATFRGANASLISPTWDYSFSDNLTWIKGDHTFKAGWLSIYNEKDQNGRSQYAGSVSFNTNRPGSTGNSFADALLGNFRSYSEDQLDPMGYFRFWQHEAFVSDSWRVSERLSVEAGVRYAWQMGNVTLGNNTTSFDPALYNASQAITVLTNGTLVAGSGNRYNGLTRPGDVPSAQTANVPNAGSPAVASIPVAGSRGYYQSQNLLAPRASFAWKPFGDDTTSVRGGAGLFYDRPEGNLYFSLVNNPPFSLSSSYENGNLANPGGGSVPALAPWASLDSLDPNLKIPRVWNWSLGVQREIPFWGLFAEVTYVGNKGQNLIRQPDINRPSFEALAANQAGPKYNTNYLRPYKGFSSINYRLSDAYSDYNALQVFLSRRRGNVNFTVNYTYSKSFDTGSGNGDGVGNDGQDWRDIEYFYGPSNNDRRHVFVSTFTYRLPFWLNREDLAGSLLAGWEISGIARFQSGAPFTVSGNTSIGSRRADFDGGSEQVSNAGELLADKSVAWLDVTKFKSAPESRLGTSGRNGFFGPSLQQWDISLRKQFRLKGSVKAQFQADFFNAFNNLILRNPATTVTNTGFGAITSAAPMRNVQLGFRVTF